MLRRRFHTLCCALLLGSAADHGVGAEPPKPGPQRVRVLSYNIHHGEGVDGKLDLERIAGVIKSVEPDLVALQEVDQRVIRTRLIDEPAELARLTKMHVAFGANLALQGGHYGNAVLSRWPIVRQKNHLVPAHGAEQRGVLEVEVELPGGRPPLVLLGTHFDFRPDDRARLDSVAVIDKLLAATPDRPALLAGDLNALPTSTTLKALANHWTRANVELLPTTPVDRPKRQIDYILSRPKGRWKTVEVRVLDEAVASDHRAMMAVLELE